MSSITCPKCRESITTCPSCGQPIEAPTGKNKGLMWGIGCLVAIPVLLVCVAVVGMLAAIAIPSFVRAREVAQQKVCVSNLQQLEYAKSTWAAGSGVGAGATVTWSDLDQDFTSMACPKDPESTCETSYRLNPIGVPPTCLHDEEHVLPGTASPTGPVARP